MKRLASAIGAASLLSGFALFASPIAMAQSIHPAGVRFAEVPANGAQMAIDAFISLPGAPGSVRFDAAALEARSPLANYQMDTRAVGAGGSIESFRSSESWYYALLNNGKPVAGVTLKMDGGRLRSSSVNTAGPFLDAIAPAVEKLVHDPRLQSGSYEARLLGFPGIFGSGMSQVIWLKSDAPGGDMIFVQPQPFVPGTLEANHLYPADEFLKLLAPIIRQRQKPKDPAQ